MGELTYEDLVANFVRGCGLRYSELKALCVADFYQRWPKRFVEQNWIHIDATDDVPAHEVPVLDEYAWTIAEVCKGKEPIDEVFPVLPDLNYEALRFTYAQSLFMLRYESLGATGGPLSLEELSQLMKQALGLTRMDAFLRNSLRRVRRELGIS